MQRMSGIATATKKLVAVALQTSATAHVVGTRKTAWGLLDKRAIYCGKGGTHRLNLGDAILVKTNHLRLASNEVANATLRRAWERRKSAAFFEVEVTSMEEALSVARVLGELQRSSEACPCILMLDNFSAKDAGRAVQSLRDAGLHDAVLVEASGNNFRRVGGGLCGRWRGCDLHRRADPFGARARYSAEVIPEAGR